MDQMKIGNFLKELRKEKGITQAQLAETLNVSARTVSRWETGSNMPDISILVDIADYYDISIPEKEKIFKEMKIQSIMGVCALVLYWILHETDAYMYSDALEKLTGYCETLVSVSVIMMAAYTTGSLSKLRSKSWKFFMIENLPKPVRLIVSAVVAFCGVAMIKLALVHFFGL